MASVTKIHYYKEIKGSANMTFSVNYTKNNKSNILNVVDMHTFSKNLWVSLHLRGKTPVQQSRKKSLKLAWVANLSHDAHDPGEKSYIASSLSTPYDILSREPSSEQSSIAIITKNECTQHT